MKRTKEEQALIIEALLFTGSVRVSHAAEEEFNRKVIELAAKINEEAGQPELTNVTWLDDEFESEEPYADKVPEIFKIKKEFIEEEDELL